LLRKWQKTLGDTFFAAHCMSNGFQNEAAQFSFRAGWLSTSIPVCNSTAAVNTIASTGVDCHTKHGHFQTPLSEKQHINKENLKTHSLTAENQVTYST